MSLVELETPAPGVRLLRLADPDRRNAISPALQADLAAALDTIAAEIAAATALGTPAAKIATASSAAPGPAVAAAAVSPGNASPTTSGAIAGSTSPGTAAVAAAPAAPTTSGPTSDSTSPGTAALGTVPAAGAAPGTSDAAPDPTSPGDRPRVLVITGAGTAFCAGADLAATFSPPGLPVYALRDRLRATYESFLRVRRLPIPTIAAVQGAAVGAGVNLALACDVRIAGPRARFGLTFSRLGLHPGGGCTHFLVRTLGPQRALSILLDGATLGAEEAHRLGLVLKLAEDPLAEACETATRWAALDPALAADIKRAVGLATDGDFDDVLEFEAWAQASSASKR
ncbi:enoyl-CoA hydratase-related protein [Amycolatopsis sp. NPDC048633]|uniref:enoyl-CoA hydratase-related protein n=1 Tax=Amycolatopsis sp. NPDC048633 TaxID=3157095 RepID=UPI0033E4A9D3